MTRPPGSQLLLWALLTLPGAWAIARWASGAATYGEVVSDTGLWAAWLLILTMAVTPLRLLVRRGAWLTWLVRQRRDLGVASAAYAGLHTGVYLVRKEEWPTILSEADEPWLLAGWVALSILLALAATSTDAAVRRMRRNWKRLHRLVYVGAALMFAHWALSAFDPLMAYTHLAAVAGLEGLRVAFQARQAARARQSLT